MYDSVVGTQITPGLLGQTYLLSIQREWISDVNFWKCLSRFCKLRAASPASAAACSQSPACHCLPFIPCSTGAEGARRLEMARAKCGERQKPVDRIPQPLTPWQRKRGTGISPSFVGLALGFGVRFFLLLALTESPGRGACGQRRKLQIVTGMEQLGVLS